MAFERVGKEVGLTAEKPTPVSTADIFKFSETDKTPWEAKSGKLKQNLYVNKGEIKNFDNCKDLMTPFQNKYTQELSEEEKVKANKIVKKAFAFVQEHSETPQEQKIADTLREMHDAGKIKVEDATAEIGFPVYGYYDPEKDIICLDINSLLDYGTAEAIDTLVHEGYHAAQCHAGHENDTVEEETRAWNARIEMSNKCRRENGETIVRVEPYTQLDVFQMGYDYTLGPNIFTDLAAKGGIKI